MLDPAGPTGLTGTLPSGKAGRGRLRPVFEFFDLDGGREGAVQAACLIAMVLDHEEYP
jgi:hypothetical protein